MLFYCDTWAPSTVPGSHSSTAGSVGETASAPHGPSGLAHSRSSLSTCWLTRCLDVVVTLAGASGPSLLTGEPEILSSQTFVARGTCENGVLRRLSAYSCIPGPSVGQGGSGNQTGSALQEEDRQKPGFPVQREEHSETVWHRGEPAPLTENFQIDGSASPRWPPVIPRKPAR